MAILDVLNASRTSKKALLRSLTDSLKASWALLSASRGAKVDLRRSSHRILGDLGTSGRVLEVSRKRLGCRSLEKMIF